MLGTDGERGRELVERCPGCGGLEPVEVVDQMGAQRSTVLWLVVRNMLGLIGAGLALGVPMMLLTKRFIESELFGVDAGDPIALAGATLLLLGVACAAGAWPAWRASRVDPTISLRYE